ncbi:MAG TPA: hybrid sensor histidine kinase/response regulator [bacterium]|nr:hybrid sensor histidine kinase/response regulator [bacterium]
MIFKIAVIEDNDDYRKLFLGYLSTFQKEWKKDQVIHLETLELEIDCYKEAELFLDSVKNDRRYDFIAIDILLPGRKTGLDVVEYLNERYPNVLKLAMSAFSVQDILMKYQDNGLDCLFRNYSCDFFEKCRPKSDLKKIIEKLFLLRINILSPFERQNDMERNRNFLYHQIRQYQTAFFMYNELMLIEMSEYFKKIDDKDKLSLLKKVFGLQDHLLTMTKSLDQMIGAKTGFAKVDLAYVIRNVITFFQVWMKKNFIECTFLTSENDWTIQGNGILLEQLIMNIIVNSIEALIQICDRSKQITISLKKTDDKVILMIVDNGGGCSEDYLDMIFQCGVSTKNHNGNSGLGLAFVMDVVKDHGAKINIESEINKYFKTEIIFSTK